MVPKDRINQRNIDRFIIDLAAREMNLEMFASEYDKLLAKKLGLKKTDLKNNSPKINDAKIADVENGVFKINN